MSRVLSTPLRGGVFTAFTPHINLKTHPGYTLPAPPLAGSPCNHWILQNVCFKEIFMSNFWSDFWNLKLQQISNFPGLRPDPSGGAYSYSAPPDPSAGGEGARCPSPRICGWLPKNLTPAFGPSGLGLRPCDSQGFAHVTHTPSR